MNKDATADATSRLLNDTITIKRDVVVDRVVRIKAFTFDRRRFGVSLDDGIYLSFVIARRRRWEFICLGRMLKGEPVNLRDFHRR